jgi:hypothetical protein
MLSASEILADPVATRLVAELEERLSGLHADDKS